MGYLVRPSGRLNLPEADDAAAVAVEAAWIARGGVRELDEFPPSDTLADIGWVAAASISRDGDWIEFGPDDEGDPKWSDRATAFYGARWSYTYAGGQITQHGWNGWDGSIEPFGEPAEFTALDNR